MQSSIGAACLPCLQAILDTYAAKGYEWMQPIPTTGDHT